MQHQKGVFLAIMSVLIIVLLGFTALAVDVGRLMVLRSEIQNAADTAALAAANELDGSPNAQQRAKLAARNALTNSSHFARVTEILSDATLQDGAFEFFCVIGSQFDIDPDDASINFNNYCGNSSPYAGSGKDAKKRAATKGEDTHYVRITLGPEEGATDNFTIDFIFLPVLNLIGAADVATELAVSASALAGRNFFSCNVAPVAICDPWEGEGKTFRSEMPIGGLVTIWDKETSWAKGGGGWLTPTNGSSSAEALGASLAETNLQSCTAAQVKPLNGDKTQMAKSGFNTRFGIYNNGDDNYGNTYNPVSGPFEGSAALYRPAKHVGAFPPDLNPDALKVGFGDGIWDCNAYWVQTYTIDYPNPVALAQQALACTPGITRLGVYNYQIAQGIHVTDVFGGTNPLKRVIPVAVLSCTSLGITTGTSASVPLFPPDGIAEFFLTTPATNPSESKFVGEFAGWLGAGSSVGPQVLHPNVALYE